MLDNLNCIIKIPIFNNHLLNLFRFSASFWFKYFTYWL